MAWSAPASLASLVGVLSQATTGLLARHDYDNSAYSFKLADWDVPADLTKALSSDALRLTVAVTSPRCTRYNALSVRTTTFVQAVVRAVTVTSQNLQFGPALHVEADAAINDNVATFFSVARTLGERITLREIINDVITGQDGYDTSARTTAQDYRIGLHVSDSRASAYDHTSNITPKLLPSTLTNGRSGVFMQAAGGAPGVCDVRRFYVMRNRYLVVGGLVSGQYVEVRDASASLASVTASGSTASVDMLFVPVPATTVRVCSSAGAVLANISPGNGVWGADEYAYSQTVLPIPSWITAAPPTTSWSTL